MKQTKTSKTPTLYIVIPAYNEADNIVDVIDAWYPIVQQIGQKSRLVIFNDGSKDDTLKILQKATKTRPQLQVVDQPNSGHGATVLNAYYYALKSGADFIFQTDSDGQTDPNEFQKFWDSRNDYDLVIGHRSTRQDGFSRIVVTKTLKLTVKLFFGVTVTDANTPFRLMNRTSLEDCLKLVPEGFNLANVILTTAYIKKGYKVKFYPITFKPRQGGVNSINIRKIFRIGKNSISDFRKINRDFKQAGL